MPLASITDLVDDLFGRLTITTTPASRRPTSQHRTATATDNARNIPEQAHVDPPPPYTPVEIGVAITTPETIQPIGLGISYLPNTHAPSHSPARHDNTRLRQELRTSRSALRLTTAHLHSLQNSLSISRMEAESLHERLLEALDQRDALMAFLQEQQAELERAKEENERLERERDALVIVLTPQKLVNAGPRPDSQEEHEAWRKGREMQQQERVERNLRALGLV